MVETSGTTINVVVGSDGPPVLLLHGYPQTHVEWRKIAPDLARNHTLVIPDLRGYGDCDKPADGDNHINYSKRAMALDQVEVMEKLVLDSLPWSVTIEGARVGHRLALDHSDRLTKLVLTAGTLLREESRTRAAQCPSLTRSRPFNQAVYQ